MAANLLGLCLFLLFSFLCHLCASCFYFWSPGFWPQSPTAENWWVARYPLYSPFGRHVRLQAWLDNHNSLNGIFWNAVISICSLNMLKFVCAYTGKLHTQGNLSLCSVKRNVKSYIYIARTKIDKSVIFCWLFFILPMFLSFTSTHVEKLM